jgi:hypothetical protein
MNSTEIIGMQLVQQATAVQRIQELEAKNKELEATNKELMAVADNSALRLAICDIQCLEEKVAQLRLALDVERAHAEKAESDLEITKEVLAGAVEYYYAKTARLEDELAAVESGAALLQHIIARLKDQDHRSRNYFCARIGTLEMDLEDAKDEVKRLKAVNRRLREENELALPYTESEAEAV